MRPPKKTAETCWFTIKEYLNSFVTGQEIQRRLLQEHCYRVSMMGYNTTDTYRLYLTRAGFIVHSGNGVYHKAKDIPPDLTLAKCIAMAYPPGPRDPVMFRGEMRG